MLLWADVVPDGTGGFKVVPKRPADTPQEVGTTKAADMLGVCRSTMWELRNHPVAGKILKWRFTTPSQRIVKFTTESVIAYREYTKTLEGK